MTDEEIRAELAICDAAVSGPWETNMADVERRCDAWIVRQASTDRRICEAYDDTPWKEQQCADNATFMAAARAGWPRALRALQIERAAGSLAMTLLRKRDEIRAEIVELEKTHTGRVSLRCLSLIGQCTLLEDLLNIAHAFPRGTDEDR
jgi:hypothetical protein